MERELERKREAMEAQITIIRREFEAAEEETRKTIALERAREDTIEEGQTAMADMRHADALTKGKHSTDSNGRRRHRENNSPKAVGHASKRNREQRGK
jgi:hypothetical protein